jgi:toxin ParE1/3/4
MKLLARSPDIGRSVPAIRPGMFKFPAASHTIFYRKSPGAIEVIRILHKSMDVESHL